jgi:L-threonylcarbamoyladenylate synthase
MPPNSNANANANANPSSDLDPVDVATAARLLEAGEVVAFPTETVYGLGGDAENCEALARIYATKGRPADHPLIVHLAPEADLSYWAHSVPAAAHALIAAFWPGPLTLILKRATHIPAMVSGGQDSLGLRCPSHPVAQALLREFRNGRGGLAGPSANRFGHVSPTSAQHVRDEFGPGIAVLDGGPCEVGIESTIVDLSRGFPALLRPGRIGAPELAHVLGEMPRQPGVDRDAPRASGTLSAHYAPHTPLLLLDERQLHAALAAWASGASGTIDTIGRTSTSGASSAPAASAAPPEPPAAAGPVRRIALIARLSTAGAWSSSPGVQFMAAPEDPERYARELYRMLRELDRSDVVRILVEKLPAAPAWDAVNDRLGRAAAAFTAGV